MPSQRKRRGRPPKKRKGGREVFGWKPVVILLLLKDRYEMTYREIAGHVHANPGLQRKLGIPRAPRPEKGDGPEDPRLQRRPDLSVDAPSGN